MPDYVRERFPRIDISYRPLGEVLEDAEYCLLDAPSSAMWDAIDARVPCQALVWSKFHVRETAVRCYADYLTFFDSDADVGEKVRTIVEGRKFCTGYGRRSHVFEKRPCRDPLHPAGGARTYPKNQAAR